jgi:hypothetical protein
LKDPGQPADSLASAPHGDYDEADMIHENIKHSIEDLSARMIAIRDSL